METIILAFAAVGLALIVTRSFLFERVRFLFKGEYLATLVNCPQCFSFWAGLALCFVSFSWFNFVCIPLMASGIGYMITLFEKNG